MFINHARKKKQQPFTFYIELIYVHSVSTNIYFIQYHMQTKIVLLYFSLKRCLSNKLMKTG